MVDGSPPHARGRLVAVADDGLKRRFTPARAGKTARLPPARPTPAVHPRTRGEDLGASGNGGGVSGSPPHARGRLRLRV